MNQLTLLPGLRCFTGRVSLFRFIQAPAPGSVIGTLTLNSGQQLPLVQTNPTPPGGTSLAAVDGQLATVCGRLTVANGQAALDVIVVNPTVPTIDSRALIILRLLSRLGLNARQVFPGPGQ